MSSGILDVKPTFHEGDPTPWRQWHQWNYNKNIGEISLKKGIPSLTLNTVTKGQINYDFLEFKLINKN